MTEDPHNLVMWAHYGEANWGTAVGLDLRHSFFNKVGTLRQVEYSPQRIAVSSNGGLIRVAGHPLNEYVAPPVETLLRKSLDWAYEKEWRLVVPLAQADETRHDGPPGETIHLLRFPETAIRSLVLGARLTDPTVENIVGRIRGDRRWQHVEIFRAVLSPREFALDILTI